MGYYVTLTESNAIIPADKLDEAFTRLKALNKRDSLKRGGSYTGGRQTAVWFSWMPENYDETAKDAAEIFELLGFELENTDDGGILIFSYDSKTGQEDVFVEAVADLFVPGSYMQWRGEDGDLWRWEFDGTKTMKHLSANITWQ